MLKNNKEKYQDHIPCSSFNKLVCVDNNFSKPIVALFFIAVEMLLIDSLKQFLESIITVKKKWKNILTKIWSWLTKKKKIFDQVTLVEYVKNSFKMKK